MKRRDVLKYTALLTGAAVAGPLALSLSSCQNDSEIRAKYNPQFFKEDEFEFIKAFVDIILPKTDSPAATEVYVHQTIDEMVGEVYTKDAQKKYYLDFTSVHEHLWKDKKLSHEDVEDIEKNASGSVKRGYQALKQQTVAYYLSSEEIGLNFLNYLPVPGEYVGCIDLAEVGGKAWTL